MPCCAVPPPPPQHREGNTYQVLERNGTFDRLRTMAHRGHTLTYMHGFSTSDCFSYVFHVLTFKLSCIFRLMFLKQEKWKRKRSFEDAESHAMIEDSWTWFENIDTEYCKHKKIIWNERELLKTREIVWNCCYLLKTWEIIWNNQ